MITVVSFRLTPLIALGEPVSRQVFAFRTFNPYNLSSRYTCPKCALNTS